MKIAKYVGDLLYDYECVVIPGLGGFITKDRGVSINEVTHNFLPPFRSVHFNIHLRANDGLLVNHVAQQEQIGYKTAKQRVDKFAFQCHHALDAGKKINFNNIGSIHYDSDKNIIFTQEIKTNYNPNSFGLGSLVSPAIRRITDEQKVKKAVKSAIDINKSGKKPIDRKGFSNDRTKRSSGKNMQANRRKSTFTNQIIFLLIVAMFMGSGYIYMRREAMKYYYDKYASNIPFFYSSINDYLSTNINSSHVAKLSRSTASFFPAFNSSEEDLVAENKATSNEIIIETVDAAKDNYILTELIEEPTIEQTKIEIEENFTLNKTDYSTSTLNTEVIESNNPSSKNHIKEVVSSNNFFVIAGSFSKESNAISLVKKLKEQGFEAVIADTNKYGMFRVAFMSYSNRTIAENELLAIRKETNPKAWLLVK